MLWRFSYAPLLCGASSTSHKLWPSWLRTENCQMQRRQWQDTQLRRFARVCISPEHLKIPVLSNADASTGALLLSHQGVPGLLCWVYFTGTMLAGAFVSQRNFDSVWNNDACMFNCLAHTIFNLTNPQQSYGKFAINNASKYVNVSVLDSSTSAVFSGDRFGCQLSLANQVRPLYKLNSSSFMRAT